MQQTEVASKRADQITGVLLGTAVGDSLGLPREGLSPARARKLYGSPPLQQSLILRRGMISDDTEHTFMAAQSLLQAPTDSTAFGRAFGWRLRFWFLALPAAIGWGTLRACVKLWLGFSTHKSGVYSAGNGPAMRAPMLGAALNDDTEQLKSYTTVSTLITHRDPRALAGAFAIALCARYATNTPVGQVKASTLLNELRACIEDKELLAAFLLVESQLAKDSSPADFANAMGLQKGITGYMPHTVAACLYCWLKYPSDFRAAVEAVISLGGDSDSTGAIVGAIAGAHLGASQIPPEWVENILEWPRSVPVMRALGTELACQFAAKSELITPRPPVAKWLLRTNWAAVFVRNMVFMVIVVVVALRRALPPY